MTGAFGGGFYSTDALFPNATGQALLANAILQFVNSTYGTSYAAVAVPGPPSNANRPTSRQRRAARPCSPGVASEISSLLLAAALSAPPAFAAIKLPASGVLAGPLDDAQSSLGDEITNYPFGTGFGAGPIHGWISVKFDPPSGSISHFTLSWQNVGDSPTITFKNGAEIFGPRRR